MNTKLPHLDVGSGRQSGALTAFPVWTDAPSMSGIDWSIGGLAVGELDEGASVGRLRVENPSRRSAVLLEGDLLVGGLQNRMAAASRMLAPRQADTVDVVCVEQGRWDGADEHRPSGLRGAPSVRHGNLMRRDGGAQGEVWRRIARYEAEFGS